MLGSRNHKKKKKVEGERTTVKMEESCEQEAVGCITIIIF